MERTVPLSLNYFKCIMLLQRCKGFFWFAFGFTFHHLHFHWMLFWKHLFFLPADCSLVSHLDLHSTGKKSTTHIYVLIQSNITPYTNRTMCSVSFNSLFKIWMWQVKWYQPWELTSVDLKIFNGLLELRSSIVLAGRPLLAAGPPDFHWDRKKPHLQQTFKLRHMPTFLLLRKFLGDLCSINLHYLKL